MALAAPENSSLVHQRWEKQSNLAVHLFQLLFLGVMLLQLDDPFVSAHNERQNQTFDMARHVFHDGWRSVITPKVSYCYPGYEKEPFTAVLQEVPFHGVLGWPLASLTGHERAAVRIVSTVFALFSIQLMYWISRFWLPPIVSALGAGIWATAPLVLHFGQVPMPDILCTTGILAAFWFALRGKLPASSVWFAFAILAKVSVIVFGLPVLVALLLAKNCRSAGDCLRLSLLWGWLPFLSIVTWEVLLYSFSPPSPMNLMEIAERGTWHSMITLGFYKFLLACMFPFGVGVMGFAGLLFAKREKESRMDRRVKWAVIVSNIVFLLFAVCKVNEPQYIVPMVPWFLLGASFGLNYLLVKSRASTVWRIGLGTMLMLHILVALFFTIDLKTSRVPNLAGIERAGQLLPQDARVVVIYRFYGAGPAVWLDRNVVSITVPDGLGVSLAEFRRAGFTHVLIVDIDSLHNKYIERGWKPIVARVFHNFQKSPPVTGNMPVYTDSAGPYRQFCDRNFSQMFAAPHVVLYSMASWHGTN